jgi:predicted nucleic acid-binding protein
VALIVLDASVLIALLDPNDALHIAARAALARHAGDDLKLPASAYAESLVGPARRGRLAAAKQAIDALLLDIVPITGQVAEEAAEIRARHSSLRLPTPSWSRPGRSWAQRWCSPATPAGIS